MVEINCDTYILNTLEKKNKISNLLIKYLKNESVEIITCKTKIAVLRLNQISENAENKTQLSGT